MSGICTWRSRFVRKMIKGKKRASEAPENQETAVEAKKVKKEKSGKPVAGKFAKKSVGKKVDKKSDASTEKTDWRKFKEEKKELKLKRKQTKDIYEISLEAKKLYEQLKCHRTENKAELVEQLYKLFNKDDILRKMVMAHDTARIVQCMLKNAKSEYHTLIAERLLPHAVEMSMSKYAHFCLVDIYKHATASVKERLVDSLLGSIIKMATHNLASKILDHIYLNVANKKQKALMRQEFYGEMYRLNKDKSVEKLSDTYKDASNMKTSILSTVKANLDRIANKNLVDNSLVHAVMLEYVNNCDDEKLEEAMGTFAPLIPHMLTTKEGCEAAIFLFYKAPSKHRRAIIKAIKEHLVKICTHEQGHVFMIGVINALDDTKATKKAIFDHLQPELETLMSNEYGRRVIQWFIAPADTNCFHPNFITSIDVGLAHSKKDKELRRKEIFEAVAEPIANAIAENPEFWLSEGQIALATANILKKLDAEHFENVVSCLAKVVVNSDWKVRIAKEGAKQKKPDIEEIIAEATKIKRKKQKIENDDEGEEKTVEESVAQVQGIEEVGLHVALKKIIKNDKERTCGKTFGSEIVLELKDQTEVLKYWLTINRACFILVNIMQFNSAEVTKALKDVLVPFKALLKEQQTSGAKLLAEKIN